MSSEYLEPIEVIEEAFAEVHKDVSAEQCRIAIMPKSEMPTSFLQICVGGDPEAKESVFRKVSSDQLLGVVGIDDREFEYYSEYEVLSPEDYLTQVGVNAVNRLNMNLVGIMDATLVYLGFTTFQSFNKWKTSTEFDYLRYIKPWLKGKLICICANKENDEHKIKEDPFFKDLNVRTYGYFKSILTSKRDNIGGRSYVTDEKQVPFELMMGLQEFLHYELNISIGLRNSEPSPFVDSMTPIPYVDESGELKNLLVGQSLITQGLYEYVMGNNPSYFKGSSELPVERVSWFDLLHFCNKLSEMQGFSPCYYDIGSDSEDSAEWDRSANGYRLLTEREWEYIARANRGFEYSGSDDPNQVAWQRGNGGAWWERKDKTHPVGTKKENSFGTYDQSGNLAEWCWDLYRSDSSERVLRGGSWEDFAQYLRAAYREVGTPSSPFYYNGSRLARSPDPTE